MDELMSLERIQAAIKNGRVLQVREYDQRRGCYMVLIESKLMYSVDLFDPDYGLYDLQFISSNQSAAEQYFAEENITEIQLIEAIGVCKTAKVLKAKKCNGQNGRYIVFCVNGTEFVTWEFKFDGGFYWGHYFGDQEAAERDYRVRA